MKPVHFRKSQQLSLSKIVISFLFVIVLASCGTNTAITSSTGGSNPKSTAATFSSLAPGAENISIDRGSLRIQSGRGFLCPFIPSLVLNQLVLASDRTTYSQDEIAQIYAYAGSHFSTTKLPPTLSLVLGGSMDSIPGTDESTSLVCGTILNLTNTGNNPIQIPQVGVQLEAHPQQNSYQYHLIDACSVILPPNPNGCWQPSGGGANCGTYEASIQLGLGEKGTIYSVVPVGPSSCGMLTIAPAAQVNLILTFSLAANIAKNLIYSLFPVFTVDTAQGRQTLSFPQQMSTLAFASANQFSCYALQGTTFVLLKSPSLPLNWCI